MNFQTEIQYNRMLKLISFLFVNNVQLCWEYRFQDFYEEGEREILLAEISNLRDQVNTVLLSIVVLLLV